MSIKEQEIFTSLLEIKNKVERSGINARRNGNKGIYDLCLSLAEDINQLIDEMFFRG